MLLSENLSDRNGKVQGWKTQRKVIPKCLGIPSAHISSSDCGTNTQEAGVIEVLKFRLLENSRRRIVFPFLHLNLLTVYGGSEWRQYGEFASDQQLNGDHLLGA